MQIYLLTKVFSLDASLGFDMYNDVKNQMNCISGDFIQAVYAMRDKL